MFSVRRNRIIYDIVVKQKTIYPYIVCHVRAKNPNRILRRSDSDRNEFILKQSDRRFTSGIHDFGFFYRFSKRARAQRIFRFLERTRLIFETVEIKRIRLSRGVTEEKLLKNLKIAVKRHVRHDKRYGCCGWLFR